MQSGVTEIPNSWPAKNLRNTQKVYWMKGAVGEGGERRRGSFPI